ncbi:hypothetical protein BC826DRAFT_377762 [Russula brevipes]|nr:hypothetical protein BC826DRAFT_377762 [Russula brevipes]
MSYFRAATPYPGPTWIISVTRSKSRNLCLGFQCFSADTITNFLFGTSFDQLSCPDFRGDIVEGVDVAMPTIAMRKFS